MLLVLTQLVCQGPRRCRAPLYKDSVLPSHTSPRPPALDRRLSAEDPLEVVAVERFELDQRLGETIQYVAMLLFVVALMASIGKSRTLANPQVPLVEALLLVETVFSLRKKA